MDLYLAPHNDDEVLWGTFTLLREKPLVVVVTDSWIQYLRGEPITWQERWNETVEAMRILDCSVVRLGIRDDTLYEWDLKDKLSRFGNFDTVYAPAIQGGNDQHDLVGKVADDLWGVKCKHYTTYTKTEPYTEGKFPIIPSKEELELKDKAMECYKTQLGMGNKVYFEAVKGQKEWFV